MCTRKNVGAVPIVSDPARDVMCVTRAQLMALNGNKMEWLSVVSY